MGIMDRDYAKDKLKELDPEEEKKYNWLMYLGIAIGIVGLIYIFVFMK
jgi:hypothetical protein